MPFGIIGRTGPGIRQVVRFGDRPTERGTFGANLGRVIVTNGDVTAYVGNIASTVGIAVWGDASGAPRHCCITWGPHRGRGRGGLGVFVPHFHNGKCH